MILYLVSSSALLFRVQKFGVNGVSSFTFSAYEELVSDFATSESVSGFGQDIGKSLEKEMATHSSILAWTIPWTEDPGRLHSWGHKELDTTD